MTGYLTEFLGEYQYRSLDLIAYFYGLINISWQLKFDGLVPAVQKPEA